VRTESGEIERVPWEGTMTAEQSALSRPLKDLFPAYVNGLSLTDDAGRPLTLDSDGEGSFADWVRRWVVASAQDELDTRFFERSCQGLQVAGAGIADQAYLEVEGGTVTGIDWDAFVEAIGRMKATPAFDAVDLSSPENEEFGDESCDARHFTAFSFEHSTAEGAELADPEVVRLMNPIPWIAPRHWRIRHGSFDRDTSLAIPVILATMLSNHGHDVDFALPWGLPHSGDYDLPQLFAWIDSLCR